MMDKKVGILTFSYSSNPGSVLQAYSLQRNISNIAGCEAQIINYQKTRAGKPVIGKTVFMPPVSKWRPKQMIEWTARIIAHPVRMYKYEKFFNRYYSGYSRKPVTRADLVGLDAQYDCFVVGSDQVWNYDSYNVDDTYFLDFVADSDKKIAYAASFGKKDVPEGEKEKLKALISDFSFVSVREKSGAEVVEKITGRQAARVLDPSLLTEKAEYRKLEKAPRKKKYVFLYLREDSKELTECANRLAEFYGLKVVKIVKHWLYGKNGKPLCAVGPEKWLGYMDHAEYIVTNSFHGICFSIIFEKEFFVGLLKQGGMETNPRISEVLDLFEIKDRYMEAKCDFAAIAPIDYSRINEKKKVGQKEAIDYLKKAIRRSVSKNATNLCTT